MSATALQLDQALRDRVSMARVICVLGMIFVHVPDGQPGAPLYAFHEGSLGLFLEGLLVEGPGRASAALLSVVSGYLAAVTLLQPAASVSRLYRCRFMSIIVPMALWSTVTWLVYFAVSHYRPTFVSEATSLLDHVNIIFFLTALPEGATMHLGFLRDLFVCILLSPILLIGVQRAAWLVLPLLGLFYLLFHSQASVIILRPLVVFAFSLGLFLASRRIRVDSLDHLFPVFIILAALCTAAIMLVNGGAAAALVDTFSNNGLSLNETVLYPLGRFFGSLAIWTFLPSVMGGSFQSWSSRCSPYLFAAFCSHYLFLTVVFFGVWLPVFGDRESPNFIIWFLAAPLTSMLIAIAMVKFAQRYVPPMASLITGGRMKSVLKQGSATARKGPVRFPVAKARKRFPVSAVEMTEKQLNRGVMAAQSMAGSWSWTAISRRILLGRR